MTLDELGRGGRQPPLPLTLDLAGEPLCIERWLRVLPGQRYVGQARWQGRAVLAKLMVGRRAARQFAREREGAAQLAGQNLATPALLAQGEGEGGAWLLFAFLDGAVSLDAEWRALADEPPQAPSRRALLEEALAAVAALHRVGLWQDDLHLDNLLRHAGRLYLVDGGGVRGEHPGRPLAAARVADNLGVLFAQLPLENDPLIGALLPAYLAANPVPALEVAKVREATRRVRQWRLRDYLDKAGRDCSLFSVRRDGGGVRAVWREAEAGLASLLEDPDGWIASGHRYKDGGTATVARVEQGGQVRVVKRYNIKNLVHRLSRCWRPSRAWHSWLSAHRLRLLGIATPTPLAVIEERWHGLRGRAYLVTDYLPGQDILACFQPYLDSAPPEAMLDALDRLFAALIAARLSHGDLKGNNLLWQARGRGDWCVIDLDAMQAHRSRAGFERAFQRDRARFMRNWPADSVLYRLLDERIPKTSLEADA